MCCFFRLYFERFLLRLRATGYADYPSNTQFSVHYTLTIVSFSLGMTVDDDDDAIAVCPWYSLPW